MSYSRKFWYFYANLYLTLPERSIGVKEARGTKTTQVNACMATADHGRPWQTIDSRVSLYYLWADKGRLLTDSTNGTVIEFTSGISPCIIDTHEREKFSS